MDDETLQELEGVLDDVIESIETKQAEESKQRQLALESAIASLGKDISASLKPYLDELKPVSAILPALKELSKQNIQLEKAVRAIKLTSPAVNVAAPDTGILSKELVKAIKGIRFNVPEVKVPEISVPAIKVPQSSVKMPEFIKVLLSQVDRMHPVPVELVDIEGNPYYPGFGGGGGMRVVGLNTADPYMDNTNNAMRVNVVAGSVTLGGILSEDHNQGPSGANTLRVVIATDSNSSVSAKETPDATATYSPTNADSTAYETGRVVKAGAGVLYSVFGYNSSTASIFIQIHNASAQPNDGVAPAVAPITVPPSSNFYFSASEKFGRFFPTGITVVGSTTGPTKTIISDASLWLDALYQ